MTPPWWLPALAAVGALALYGAGVRRLVRRGDRWPASRSICLLAGLGLALVSVLPPLADPPTFPLHIAQHLLLAMAAPFALASSAPATLALRTLPPHPRRLLLRLVHSRLARALMSAPVVLVLEVGGLAALLLTGLFTQLELHPWLHLLVHGHMFLTGCLFSWYLVGVDPMRHRPSTGTKIAVLIMAAGAHDLIAKLLVAWNRPAGEPPAALQAGAQLLFTGGDLVDAALMAAVLLEWYRRGGRELARGRRRADASRGGSAGPPDVCDPSKGPAVHPMSTAPGRPRDKPVLPRAAMERAGDPTSLPRSGL